MMNKADFMIEGKQLKNNPEIYFLNLINDPNLK